MNAFNFTPKRKTFSFTQTINTTPEIIFPLLCPERETEWLDAWTYKMIYSISGLAEFGAVFSTAVEGEGDTIWVITKHDKMNFIVEFARFTPEVRTCVLTIKVTAKDKITSFVEICYIYTGLSEKGNRYLDAYTKEEFDKAMQFWEDSMNYFLETGKTLRH
jgi:hypothetical protein